MHHDHLWLCAAVLLAAFSPTLRVKDGNLGGDVAESEVPPVTSLPKRSHAGKLKVNSNQHSNSPPTWNSAAGNQQQQQQEEEQQQQLSMQEQQQEEEEDETPLPPVACRDSDGSQLDWFIALKMPASTQPQAAGNNGLRYCYVASNSQRWRCHDDIREEEGPIYRTVSQALTSNRHPVDVAAAYSDFPPGESPGRREFAHMRGLLMIRNRLDRDVGSGFWLLHSVRHFPALDEFRFPPSGILYGQSFMCVSFDRNDFYALKHLVFRANPFLYHPKLRFKPAEASEFVNGAKFLLNGHRFRYFSKVNSPDVDVFERASAALNSPLHVQTWNDTIDNARACNVLGMRMPHGAYRSSVDHSKWCVTAERHAAGSRWVCVGDVNRHTKRNGGLACLASDTAHKLLLDSLLLRCL